MSEAPQPSPLRRARRLFDFVRHVPPDKLVRRAELRLRALWPRAAKPSLRTVWSVSDEAPSPLFPPRTHLLTPDRASVRLLGRDITSARTPDWSAPHDGPSQQLSRMQLHYMEWLEALDDETFLGAALGWVNAGLEGPARRDAWNSFTLSIRVVVWMQQIAARRARLPPDDVERLNRSIVHQLDHLCLHLETDLGGNHLLKNIKALIWAGTYFQGAAADRWRRRGLELLRRELSAQILPDGVHFERSVSYHCQTLADLLEVRWCLAEDPFDGVLDATLLLMSRAALDLSHPDGRVAQFNDAGLTSAYSGGECATAYGRMFGVEPGPARTFGYEAAGYFGHRGRRIYVVVDCGKIGPDDLPGHAHGDILSFELSVDGARFVVDQGVFEYEAGARRQASRSAENHNTFCFAGADQAEFFAAFRVGRRPKVSLEAWLPSDEGFVLRGSHNGFRALPGAPRHRREFEVSEEAIQVTDWVSSSSGRTGAVRFLLHPAVEVELDGRSADLWVGSTRVRLASTRPMVLEPARWWPDLGVERPTRRIVIPFPEGECEHLAKFIILRNG